MRIITRTVWILSLVSCFADVASEMLYPVIPLYLQQIGFSAAWIGVLEGVAAFTAGISKGYFGKLSDEKELRLPFIKTGYFLSAISKPMMAITAFKLWIFFARTVDRLGKGIPRMRDCSARCIVVERSHPRNQGPCLWLSPQPRYAGSCTETGF